MQRSPMVFLVLAWLVLLAGCVNIHIDEGTVAAFEQLADDMNKNAMVAAEAEARSAGSMRHFLVVRGTVLGEADPAHGPVVEGETRPQILLDASVVYAPDAGELKALTTATPYAHEGSARIWLGGMQAPDASFGLEARVVELPSIVTLAADEAKVEVTIDDKRRRRELAHALEATPWIEDQQLRVMLAYTFRIKARGAEEGVLVRSVPASIVRGPAARVWILEIEPAGTPVPAQRTESTDR